MQIVSFSPAFCIFLPLQCYSHYFLFFLPHIELISSSFDRREIWNQNSGFCHTFWLKMVFSIYQNQNLISPFSLHFVAFLAKLQVHSRCTNSYLSPICKDWGKLEESLINPLYRPRSHSYFFGKNPLARGLW